jgi:hypothetical protein
VLNAHGNLLAPTRSPRKYNLNARSSFQPVEKNCFQLPNEGLPHLLSMAASPVVCCKSARLARSVLLRSADACIVTPYRVPLLAFPVSRVNPRGRRLDPLPPTFSGRKLLTSECCVNGACSPISFRVVMRVPDDTPGYDARWWVVSRTSTSTPARLCRPVLALASCPALSLTTYLSPCASGVALMIGDFVTITKGVALPYSCS